MAFTLELAVAARPQQVFEFVSDFRSTPRWYSAVQRVDRVEGTGGVGTRYLVQRELPSGRAENEVEITGLVPGHEVTFTSRRGPTPFSYRYVIEPDDHGTRLALHGTISGAGLTGLAALLAPAAEVLFKRGMRENLGQLRRILEGAR